MLFSETIFGPVQSRRLGTSLGVNLLPVDGKVCSFDCIYCECGFNAQGKGRKTLPSRQEVGLLLEKRLKEMRENGSELDVITFAGNGEPTIHPQFPEIIDDTIRLRDRYYPNAHVSVLSNSTQIGKQEVVNALLKVDNNILKLDSADQETFKRMNAPGGPIEVNDVIERLMRFDGKLIVQTLFLRGEVNGRPVDNTTPHEIALWKAALYKIKPRQVMIYTLDRPTPETNLQKVSLNELNAIANILRTEGFEVSVAG